MGAESAQSAGESSDQPVWSYLRARPTEAGLDPARIRVAFERLSRRAREIDSPIECLLVRRSEALEYLFGFESTTAPAGTLRGGFPETYELSPSSSNPLVDTPFESLTDPEVTDEREREYSTDLAALELHARGERQQDWQLGLTSFADALDSESVPPLAAIADLLATTTIPIPSRRTVNCRGPRLSMTHLRLKAV